MVAGAGYEFGTYIVTGEVYFPPIQVILYALGEATRATSIELTLPSDAIVDRAVFDIKAEKGQFLKAEPGAARLIGIVSTPLTLDFRELRERGFAFNALSCGVDISNGALTTRDFRMSGPSAQVSMSGRVDVVNETQDLQARVEPSVGEGTALVVAAVINPVWGLGAFILQKILNNPLGQALTFDYHVTGTWTEPHVDRLKAEVRSVSPQLQPSLP